MKFARQVLLDRLQDVTHVLSTENEVDLTLWEVYIVGLDLCISDIKLYLN